MQTTWEKDRKLIWAAVNLIAMKFKYLTRSLFLKSLHISIQLLTTVINAEWVSGWYLPYCVFPHTVALCSGIHQQQKVWRTCVRSSLWSSECSFRGFCRLELEPYFKKRQCRYRDPPHTSPLNCLGNMEQGNSMPWSSLSIMYLFTSEEVLR